VVMFASKELRRFGYSCFSDWPGGVYATPTIAGSRPGALVAVGYKVLMAVVVEVVI
jgi:sphinganine-1-phosphate aldolase